MAKHIEDTLDGRLKIFPEHERERVALGIFKHFLSSDFADKYLRKEIPKFDEIVLNNQVVQKIKTKLQERTGFALRNTERNYRKNIVYQLTEGGHDLEDGLKLCAQVGVDGRAVKSSLKMDPHSGKLSRKGSVKDNWVLNEKIVSFWLRNTTELNNCKEVFRDCAHGDHARDENGKYVRDPKTKKKMCTPSCKIHQFRTRDKSIRSFLRIFFDEHPEYENKDGIKGQHKGISENEFYKKVPGWVKLARREHCVCEYHMQYDYFLKALVKCCLERHNQCSCVCSFCDGGKVCIQSFEEMKQRPSLFLRQVIQLSTYNNVCC